MVKAAAHFGGCGGRGRAEELDTRSLVEARPRPVSLGFHTPQPLQGSCLPPSRPPEMCYRDCSLGERGHRAPSWAVPRPHQGVPPLMKRGGSLALWRR